MYQVTNDASESDSESHLLGSYSPKAKNQRKWNTKFTNSKEKILL